MCVVRMYSVVSPRMCEDVDECTCIVIYNEPFVQTDNVKCNNLLKLRSVKIEK